MKSLVFSPLHSFLLLLPPIWHVTWVKRNPWVSRRAVWPRFSPTTLTSYFIRYILLGWTPLCLHTVLIFKRNSTGIEWRKHSSEIVVHIDVIESHSCCKFISCTSVMMISHLTTSQRCSAGVKCGDCGELLFIFKKSVLDDLSFVTQFAQLHQTLNLP